MTKAEEVFLSQLKDRDDELWLKKRNSYQLTREFHIAFGMPVNQPGYQPTVSDRLLRGKLLLEETIETICKGLGLTIQYEGGALAGPDQAGGIYNQLTIEHYEGDMYDPVETLDGLADVKVIANGTAVAFGLPMTQADWEVFCSNMTKLDEDGQAIVNRCNADGCAMIGTAACEFDQHYIDPNNPAGKVLKSHSYTPADIASIIEESKA